LRVKVYEFPREGEAGVWKKKAMVFLIAYLFCAVLISAGFDLKALATPFPKGVIKDRRLVEGRGQIEVSNHCNQDAVVCLTEFGRKKAILVLYVRRGHRLLVEKMADGYYEVYFAFGEDWDQKTKRFLKYQSYHKFKDPIAFTTTRERRCMYYTVWKIDLCAIPGGKAQTEELNPEDFPEF